MVGARDDDEVIGSGPKSRIGRAGDGTHGRGEFNCHVIGSLEAVGIDPATTNLYLLPPLATPETANASLACHRTPTTTHHLLSSTPSLVPTPTLEQQPPAPRRTSGPREMMAAELPHFPTRFKQPFQHPLE